jgi:hypothetical protein
MKNTTKTNGNPERQRNQRGAPDANAGALAVDLAGAVLVYKRIRQNPVWKREPFTYAQAWLDLLLLAVDAQSTPQEVWTRGERITLELGQVGWSIAALAEEWNRSREWVMAFLKWCQNKGMLLQSSSGRGTVITILNYAAYQKTGAAAGATPDLAEEPEKSLPEIPDDAVLGKFFAEFRDPARGVAGIPEVWWRGWVAHRLNSGKWPADWRRAATMAFLADFQARHPKALGNGNNAAAIGRDGGRPSATPAQRRFEITRELDEIKARLDSHHETNIQPDANDVRRERELERALKALDAEVNHE